jgi:hypothetical protein
MGVQSYLFGLQSFHVDNCRSKGDHNDSDTLIVVVSTNRDLFPSQQILLGDNFHAGDKVLDKLVGPFDIDETALVTVTYTVLNGIGGSDADAIALKIGGAVLGVLGGLEGANFAGLDSKVEAEILSAVGGVLAGIGELIGISPSDPDCSGPVAVRTVSFPPGLLNGASQSLGPVIETQRSPSDCGNDPHSTVVYLAQPIQGGWRACKKCQSFFFGPFKGACPAGGQHDETGSFKYVAMFGVAEREQVQGGWRACTKCQSLFFGPFKGVCPAGGQHDETNSLAYVAPFGAPEERDGVQAGWRACNKCQSFFFGPFKGVCPAGGQHDETSSFAYGAPFSGS